MPEIKEFDLRDLWKVVLIIFSCIYIGIGFGLLEIYSSDFYAFNPPFDSPFTNSVLLPCLVLVIPTIVLSILYLLFFLIHTKTSVYFLILIITICIVFYLLRVNYILNPGYAMSNGILALIALSVLIIIIAFNRFAFIFFQLMIVVSLPLSLYFCYQYYNFLEKNKIDIKKIHGYSDSVGNSDTPVFVVIFDELSSYLLLDKNGKIDEELFPDLADFSRNSTWYPNAVSVVSETVTSVSNLFSGFDYFKDCSDDTEYCEHSIITELSAGKMETKDIRKLGDIASASSNMDSWFMSFKIDQSYTPENHEDENLQLPRDSYRRYGSSYRDIKEYIKNIFDVYRQHVINPKWSFKILGVTADFGIDSSNLATGAIKKGLPDSYGFMTCATNGQVEIKRFNTFIDRINTEKYKINSIHTSLTHYAFCYGPNGLVEVVYPIREIKDKYGKAHYLPDAVASREYTQSSCTDDEIAFNMRRSRINQSMLAMNLFGKTIKKIRDLGVYDKSLVVAVSDHGTGFLGPSLGRGNHKLRSREDMLDNRMMNASIPLLIKYPGQREAETDSRMVSPIDVAATVFDILDYRPPWRLDGKSILSDKITMLDSTVNIFQILYDDNSWKSWMNGGRYLPGEVIKPALYYPEFSKHANKFRVSDSEWIGRDLEELHLMDEKTGKLEFLKIEKSLPGENKGDYVLTLGGYSYDHELNPSPQTLIAVNGKIIKSIKPCLGFTRPEHKMGDILGGWLVTIPRELIKTRKLNIRAFSPVDKSGEKLFYELDNPINIELTGEQLSIVGSSD